MTFLPPLQYLCECGLFIAMKIHPARAVFMLASYVETARLIAYLRLAVFEPSALGRGIEMVSDALKVRHSMQSTTMSARSKATMASSP